MKLQIPNPKREIRDIINFRPAKDVASMLTRALDDHPILSRIINHCVREQLKAAGYARKRELAKVERQ